MNLRLPRGKDGGTGELESVGYGKPTRTYCRAQGALLKVRKQPGWEGRLGGEQIRTYVLLSHSAVPLKLSHVATQLCSNIK